VARPTARLLADPVAWPPDDSLLLLRRWLRIVGYRPHTAGFIFNLDCADRAVERVERVAEALNATTGRRVAIIGHSRGGHLAESTGYAPGG
jgi:pimeloyl-ACP methyl ester carboxylesterase